MVQKPVKQQVEYNQICLMPFLLQAIRHNQTEEVRKMLEINHNYFYDEDKSNTENNNWLIGGAGGCQKRNCILGGGSPAAEPGDTSAVDFLWV